MIKALRLYDGVGLVRPAEVEPGNGYRRYHESHRARPPRGLHRGAVGPPREVYSYGEGTAEAACEVAIPYH